MHFQTFRFWIHATVLGPDTEHQIYFFLVLILESVPGTPFWALSEYPGMNPKTEWLKCINYSGHVILDENFFFLSEVGRALEVQTSVPVADFKKFWNLLPSRLLESVAASYLTIDRDL